MLAGIGTHYYWPGDGFEAVPIESSFEDSVSTGMVEGGGRGGFEIFLLSLLVWMGTL